MKLTDISNNKAKEIIEGAPKEATHFSCIEGKTQYYKNETVISSLDEVFINVFRDIFQPSVFLLSDLENQMNIDKVETQSEELHLDPQQGEVWRCILLPRQYVVYLYKAHNEWDTDWVNSELLEGQTIKPIQKLYTQGEVEAMPNAVATEHQEEMRSFSGEIEWNGEGLPPVGAIYTVDPNHDVELLCKYSSKYVAIGEMLPKERYNGVEVIIDTFAQRDRVFRKPETPQQREDRERLEAAYDLFSVWALDEDGIPVRDFKNFSSDNATVSDWLRVVDKTNYRKGVK